MPAAATFALVTLILGMSKPEGIYLSVDYRLTLAGAVVDDAAVKFVHVIFPPLEGGPSALIGYAGVAFARDRKTPTGQWIRETLRGDMSEGFDDAMKHLRSRLNRDYLPMRQPLIINMLVMHEGKRYFGALSNLLLTGRLNPAFEYQLRELTDWYGFTNGSGGPTMQAQGQHLRLQRLTHIVPRKPMDTMNLLAVVNREVAAADKSVSPFCQVAFINADERFSPTSQVFIERGETVPFSMPILLGGIDLTDGMTDMMKRFDAFRSGKPDPPESDPPGISRRP